MPKTALAAIMVLWGTGVLHTQDGQNPLDRDAALAKAWSLLTAAVESTNPQEQLAAVPALTIAETPRALDIFERLASTGTPAVRSTAFWYLPTKLTRNNLELLRSAIHDPDLSVRRNAIHHLGFVRDASALAILRDVIARGDADTIEDAVGAARNLGSSGLAPLLRGIDGANDHVVLACIRTLNVMLDPVFTPAAADNLTELRSLLPLPALARALRHSDTQIRLFSALIAARLGSGAGAAELTKSAESSELRLGTIFSGHHAMAALNSLGQHRYLLRLSAALQDPKQGGHVATALTSFPHRSTRPILERAWRDKSIWRYQILRGLLTNPQPPDLRLLRGALRDQNPHIRLIAAEALSSRVIDDEVLDAVEQLALQPDTRVRALDLLNRRGNHRRTAALARELLPKALEQDAQSRGYDSGFRFAVVHTLEVTADREAIPMLAALFGPDRNLNFSIVRALVAIDGDTARDALVRAMNNADPSARILAAGGVIRRHSR